MIFVQELNGMRSVITFNSPLCERPPAGLHAVLTGENLNG
jgi:hypothetical protein